MASVVQAELKCKDGRRRQFAVQTEGDLKSLSDAVKKLSCEISGVLTEIVEEERSAERGERRAHDDDEEEEDEEEEDDREDAATETAAVKLKSERPAKRLKTAPPS